MRPTVCPALRSADMELRQLEAFVAVATELHFGRAAEQLGIGQPTLSDLIRRLERELGATLLTRTTRKVGVTGAGQELLGRAKVILDEVAAAAAAVRRTAAGDTGTVRVSITPPVAPMLAPHLCDAAREHLPGVGVTVQRMWLPNLVAALADGTTDVAITCARLARRTGRGQRRLLQRSARGGTAAGPPPRRRTRSRAARTWRAIAVPSRATPCFRRSPWRSGKRWTRWD